MTEIRVSGTDDPITEEWLRAVGFKWHQLARQPDKHWLLWIGELCGSSFEDLGIEVAPSGRDADPWWFCWLRADYSGRYSRFVHIRHLRSTRDLTLMFEGLTRTMWTPTETHIGGIAYTWEHAKRLRAEDQRLDRLVMRETPWRDTERDDTRGRALPEHLAHHAGDPKEQQ